MNRASGKNAFFVQIEQLQSSASRFIEQLDREADRAAVAAALVPCGCG